MLIRRCRNISLRNKEQLDSLPTHLQYYSERWDSGLAYPTCFMLTSIYLTYRHLDFQILRLLQNNDADAPLSLVQVAADVVTTVLHVGSLRSRASFLAHDFEFLVSALPCYVCMPATDDPRSWHMASRAPPYSLLRLSEQHRPVHQTSPLI